MEEYQRFKDIARDEGIDRAWDYAKAQRKDSYYCIKAPKLEELEVCGFEHAEFAMVFDRFCVSVGHIEGKHDDGPVDDKPNWHVFISVRETAGVGRAKDFFEQEPGYGIVPLRRKTTGTWN